MSSVHIEFLQVQTWLFAVPRLRAMVGANTLLGEVLRFDLPELYRSNLAWESLPVAGGFPEPLPDDPISNLDDPASDAKAGIIARDGGHFEAEFTEGAAEFADAAAALLRQRLPGLQIRISVDDEVRQYGGARVSPELPVFARCEWTGRGLASVVVQQGDETASVSLDVGGRHSAAKRAQDGKAQDIASLLTARTELAKLKTPQTFSELAGDGYLALIHADGNGVGSGAANDDVAVLAAFFHTNRVLLRRAVKTAVDRVCPPAGTAPLTILMLGGDDLLVACRADTAMSFVVELNRELRNIQEGREGFALTLGIGIVFSRPSVPVHRLHEVAEELASSAKTKFRMLPPADQASVVDWAVYSTAWVGDSMEARRRDWIRGTAEQPRVLSQRPHAVLGDNLRSLEGLLEASAGLSNAPRSQLRALVDELFRGERLAELSYRGMSRRAKQALQEAGVDEVWDRSSGLTTTSVLDLVEVYEVPLLGRTSNDGQSGDGNDTVATGVVGVQK